MGNAVAHGYIWVWLAIFALPFLATLAYSLRTPTGEWSFSAYQYVFGSFKDNLLLSFETTVLTIVINLVISIPGSLCHRPLSDSRQELSALDAEPFALHPGGRHGSEPGDRATPFSSAFRRR